MQTRVCASAVFALAGSASAQDFFPSLAAAGLTVRESDQVEARFRADTTNWNTRLAFDGAPTPSDTTANTGNGRANYENQTFGFDLSYTTGTATFDLTITRPDTTTSTISLPAPDIDQLNTLLLSTSGSRGAVSLTGFEFSGGSFFVDAFPSVDTAPGGPTFVESFLYFGDAANLTAFDWSLTGDVSFGAFTRSNPSEGTKLNLRLIDTIPAPGTTALLAAGGLLAARRRR